MGQPKDTLTVIVNGAAVEIEANEHAPLRSIIGKALERTGNVGQPPENWELRDEGGILLDLGKKIGDYHFPDHVRLFLNLKAGVNG